VISYSQAKANVTPSFQLMYNQVYDFQGFMVTSFNVEREIDVPEAGEETPNGAVASWSVR